MSNQQPKAAASDLTADQQMIRESVRKLAEEKFKPGAAAADRGYRVPMENIAVLAGQGFTGAFIPPEFGGVGLGALESVLVFEEVARSCANTAVVLALTNGAAPQAIYHLGTDAQKAKYLPGFIDGTRLAAWAMSEPGAGSDVASSITRAVPRGDSYVLNGSKIWVTGSQVADVFVVFTRMSDAPGMKGIGAVILEKGTPGFTIGKHLDLIGLRGTGMAPLFFESCEIPAENALVPAGAMRSLFNILNSERIASNPAVGLGVAQAALREAVSFLQERKQFGSPLSSFQGLQWKLADMALDIESARAMVYRAAMRAEAGTLKPWDASMAKIAANEMSVRVTNTAIQLCGASGLSEEYPFERYFRDARGLSIGYGTTEIHRNTIAAEILGGHYPL